MGGNLGFGFRTFPNGISTPGRVSIERVAKRWRQLTVWLHILTSVSWMAQVMTLGVLLRRPRWVGARRLRPT